MQRTVLDEMFEAGMIPNQMFSVDVSHNSSRLFIGGWNVNTAYNENDIQWYPYTRLLSM